MTLSICYCTVIRVPNADEFLKGRGSPELENQFSIIHLIVIKKYNKNLFISIK